MNDIQLKIGGKERTLLFDIGTLKMLTRDKGAPADPSNELLIAADTLLKVCYYGLLRSYKQQKKDPDFDLEIMEEWVDALSYQDGVSVLKVYHQSYEVQGAADVVTGDAEEADKKK